MARFAAICAATVDILCLVVRSQHAVYLILLRDGLVSCILYNMY